MPDSLAADVVLVVDDAPESLSLLTEILERNAMTALVANSAKAALTLLERITPDLILMDAIMPEMDGFQACRAIKEIGALAHVPIIFMTGLAETEHVVKGFQAGGVDYVTKPIAPDEIMARIRTHLGNSRLAQSARIALDVSGRTLIAVNARGETLWSTPQAAKLMRAIQEELGAGDVFRAAELRPVLLDIVDAKKADIVLWQGDHSQLLASYVGQVSPGEFLLSLSDGTGPKDDEMLARQLNLTGREAEVLLWIAQGKSNRDIADILKCSHRTVNKHLEQIYSKLGVENRTAAAAIAIRSLIDR